MAHILVHVWRTALLDRKWGHASIQTFPDDRESVHLNFLPPADKVPLASVGFSKPGRAHTDVEDDLLTSTPPDVSIRFDLTDDSIRAIEVAFSVFTNTSQEWALTGGSWADSARTLLFKKPPRFSTTSLVTSLLLIAQIDISYGAGRREDIMAAIVAIAAIVTAATAAPAVGAPVLIGQMITQLITHGSSGSKGENMLFEAICAAVDPIKGAVAACFFVTPAELEEQMLTKGGTLASTARAVAGK